MKKLCLFFLFTSLLTMQVKAQFLGGFFSQQSTQRKLMAEQIAGFQVYLNAVKNGYGIAKGGLNTAHELKNGTFGLHADYFNSLEQVNPVIANNPKGAAIAGMKQQALTLFNSELSWQQKQKLLSKAELAQLQKVADNLQKEMEGDLTELTQVLTPGKLQLTDQQRLERLDHLYEVMKDKLAFAGFYTARCRKLATARQQAQKDNEQIRKLYGIQ
jgi:hypothetical protein